MSTFEIGLGTKFINTFSSAGRIKNKFYRDMNKKGLGYILQRNLKDGSSVILAYTSPEGKYAHYSMKVNPDSSSIYKHERVFNILNPKGNGTEIEKFWYDKKNRLMQKGFLTIKRKDGQVYHKDSKLFKDNELVRSEYYRGEGAVVSTGGTVLSEMLLGVKRMIVRNDKRKHYSRKEFHDGRVSVEKSINGVDYFFATKKDV